VYSAAFGKYKTVYVTIDDAQVAVHQHIYHYLLDFEYNLLEGEYKQ
jgi:hypothetical protein